MSRLSELIRDLCPDGVEYRPMGEVAVLERGTPITKKQIGTGDIPVIAGGREPAYSHNVANREGETLVVAGSGAYAGYVSYWDRPVFVSDAFSVKVDGKALLPRFVYHWMLGSQNKIHSFKSGGGVPHVYAKDVARLLCPIPPLEVQQEIVRILDQFTMLEAELEAELKARRKQYEYYRDLLIESCDRTGEGLLGDSSSIFRGASPRPIRSYVTRSGGVPWIKIGDVGSDDKYVTHTAECITSEGAKRSRRVFPGNFILSNSMSFGRPYISKIEGCVHDGWLIVSSFDEAYISDFLYHLLRSSLVQMSFRQRAGRGTVRNLNVDIVAATQVPLVPLEEQKRVLRLLDRFDALVNDISSGLPAEIAARRKQYEHYRDRLLSFPEKEA